jgi:hypothetical protein
MKTINHGLGDYTIELTKAELNQLRFFIGMFNNYRTVAECVNPEQRQIATNIAKALYNYDVDIDLNQKD